VARASQTTAPALDSQEESRQHWKALRFWLVTAAASVVALFIVMVLYQRSTKTATENAQLAMSHGVANPAPAESASHPMAAPAPEPKLDLALPPASAQPPRMPLARAAQSPKPVAPPQSQALDLSARAKSSAPATASRESSAGFAAKQEETADAASVAQVAPSAAPPVQTGSNASKQAMHAQRAAPSGMMSSVKKAQASAKDLVVTSPGTQITWTIHTNHVQYTENGQPAPVQDFLPTNSAIAAGSSPGGNVCWLVGADGAVVLTTDGRLWLGTTSPTTSDLTAIKATSAKAATVTSADGHTYTTANGGQTWKPQN
jgi:hypothetical protein